jgi:hypothetical protein
MFGRDSIKKAQAASRISPYTFHCYSQSPKYIRIELSAKRPPRIEFHLPEAFAASPCQFKDPAWLFTSAIAVDSSPISAKRTSDGSRYGPDGRSRKVDLL